MPFKPVCLIENYQIITGEIPPFEITKKLENYRAITSQIKKAEIIREIVNEITKINTQKITSQIMLNCGTHCIGSTMITQAKNLLSKSTNIKDFIDKLNENHIGGGRLKYKKGIITGGYNKCWCGSVSQTKQRIPIEYCSCSAGWYKKLFEEVLQREVKVIVVNSIISGSKTCDFKITIC